MLKIRPFRRQDAEAVCEMMHALAAFHGDTIETTPQFFIDNCLGRNRLAYCQVAFYKDEPAGFVLSYDKLNFVAMRRGSKIDLLYVEEKFQGKKIGQALMEAAVFYGRKRGCVSFEVTAEMNNSRANAFYQKLGWELRPHTSNRYKYPQ